MTLTNDCTCPRHPNGFRKSDDPACPLHGTQKEPDNAYNPMSTTLANNPSTGQPWTADDFLRLELQASGSGHAMRIYPAPWRDIPILAPCGHRIEATYRPGLCEICMYICAGDRQQAMRP